MTVRLRGSWHRGRDVAAGEILCRIEVPARVRRSPKRRAPGVERIAPRDVAGPVAVVVESVAALGRTGVSLRVGVVAVGASRAARTVPVAVVVNARRSRLRSIRGRDVGRRLEHHVNGRFGRARIGRCCFGRRIGNGDDVRGCGVRCCVDGAVWGWGWVRTTADESDHERESGKVSHRRGAYVYAADDVTAPWVARGTRGPSRSRCASARSTHGEPRAAPIRGLSRCQRDMPRA